MEINLNEYAVMELLYLKGGQATQEISGCILPGTGSIIYVIDNLEDKDFLYRRPCPKNRRKMFAGIMEAGKEYMDARVVKQESLINPIFDEWNEGKLKTQLIY